MTTRIFRVSIPEGLDLAFAFVATCINSAGLIIQNPETGKITSWSDEGEQTATESDELLRKIKSGELKNVQFWSSASEDMFVSWIGDGRVSNFSLYLDGVDIARSVSVASRIIEGLLTQYENRMLSGDIFAMNFE